MISAIVDDIHNMIQSYCIADCHNDVILSFENRNPYLPHQ